MGLIQRLIVWVMAVVLFLAFPWLILPASVYWAWRRGYFRRAFRAAGSWAQALELERRISSLDSSVSDGMTAHEARIRYCTPREEAPFIVVEKGGEEMVFAALTLRDRAGNRSDFGRVVAEAMALNTDLRWSMAFSFFLSEEGDVGALIAMERRAPSSNVDLAAVEGEVVSRLDELKRGLASVAPSLSVEALRGKGLASYAVWGARD